MAATPQTAAQPNALPPPASAEGLRLTPSRDLAGGLQPGDVAAPIRRPPVVRHKGSPPPQPRPGRAALPATDAEISPPRPPAQAAEGPLERGAGNPGVRGMDNLNGENRAPIQPTKGGQE
jgi:hypothetical protein